MLRLSSAGVFDCLLFVTVSEPLKEFGKERKGIRAKALPTGSEQDCDSITAFITIINGTSLWTDDEESLLSGVRNAIKED